MTGRASGGALVTTSGNVVPTRRSSTKKFPIVPEAPSSLKPYAVTLIADATSVAVTPALVSAVGLIQRVLRTLLTAKRTTTE